MSATWFPATRVAAADGRYFCVVGDPVAHSRSPFIHGAFAQQFGQSLVYDKVRVEAGALAAAVSEFRAAGGRGMNITVPLKGEAWTLADSRTPRAQAAGAANTLWFDEAGRTVVDNTDGVGLVRDLVHNHGVTLAGAEVLLLGVGGAGRGVIPALLEAGVATLVLSNRSAGKVHEVMRTAASPERLQALPWGEAGAARPDIIINATSLSLSGAVPPLPPALLHRCQLCYDMMYAREATAFCTWALAHGAAAAVDGRGMLVEQAAEAFRLWHGCQPQTAPVIAALAAS